MSDAKVLKRITDEELEALFAAQREYEEAVQRSAAAMRRVYVEMETGDQGVTKAAALAANEAGDATRRAFVRFGAKLAEVGPSLLAELQALRAKLAEVEGALRDVTRQRDTAVKAPAFSRSELDTDVCDDCGDLLSGADDELAARASRCARCAARALEAAR